MSNQNLGQIGYMRNEPTSEAVNKVQIGDELNQPEKQGQNPNANQNYNVNQGYNANAYVDPAYPPPPVPVISEAGWGRCSCILLWSAIVSLIVGIVFIVMVFVGPCTVDVEDYGFSSSVEWENNGSQCCAAEYRVVFNLRYLLTACVGKWHSYNMAKFFLVAGIILVVLSIVLFCITCKAYRDPNWCK